MTILRSGSATHVGRVRTINEDQALEGATLFAVADGMGGHAGGDVAARTAIGALQQRFAAQPSPNGLLQAVRDANDAVWQRSRSDPDLRGMGTTLVAVGLVNSGGVDHLVLANVGDSRAYRLRDGALEQLSVDHSVAEELVARGELTPAEAEIHPHRHILTRALGVDADVEVDLWELVPVQGDRLVLCSDGLSNELTRPEVAAVITSSPDPQEAADALVARANAAGGNDNITVVVVDVLVGDEGAGDRGEAASTAMSAAAVVAPATGDGATGSGDATSRAGTQLPAASTTAGAPPSEGASASSSGSSGVRAGVAPLSIATVPAGLLDEPPPRAPPTGAATRPKKPRRPRRITFRVVAFILLVGAIGTGAYLLVRWYARASYYVGLAYAPSLATCSSPPNPQSTGCQQVVIYQGRAGGVLGIQPKIVVRYSDLSLGQVPQAALLVVPNIKTNVEEPSLAAARSYIHGIKCQANLVAPVSSPPFPDEVNCPITSLPPGPATTTVPRTTTTTKAAA
jgi:PPM family protein phosphatase